MNLKLLTAVLAGTVLLASCQKDTSVETGVLDYLATHPASTSSIVGNSDCKDCVYVPVCSGSVYQYSDTSGSGASASSYAFQYIKDTVISAITYHKYSGENGTISYNNCTAGNSTAIQFAAGNAAEVKLTGLQANQPVGGSWTDEVQNIGGQQLKYTYTIMSKGNPHTVAGHSYADVIHVHAQATSLNGTMNTPAGQTENYYAKNIGLIESICTNASGDVTDHKVLSSAFIP